MAVTCLQCKRLDLQKFPKHSATGFGRCPLDPVGSFVRLNLARSCDKFQQADAAKVAGRVAWYGKLAAPKVVELPQE